MGSNEKRVLNIRKTNEYPLMWFYRFCTTTILMKSETMREKVIIFQLKCAVLWITNFSSYAIRLTIS